MCQLKPMLAVATETLVFITVLLQNKDGMEVTESQIKPNLRDQTTPPHQSRFPGRLVISVAFA